MSLENFTIQPWGNDKSERKEGYRKKLREVHRKYKAFLVKCL